MQQLVKLMIGFRTRLSWAWHWNVGLHNRWTYHHLRNC